MLYRCLHIKVRFRTSYSWVSPLRISSALLRIFLMCSQPVEYAVRVRKINNLLNETKPFLDTLRRLEEAYTFTRDYSRKMKMTMVEKLKEKVDSGHVFI